MGQHVPSACLDADSRPALQCHQLDEGPSYHGDTINAHSVGSDRFNIGLIATGVWEHLYGLNSVLSIQPETPLSVPNIIYSR